MLNGSPLLRVQIVKSLRIDSRHAPKLQCFAFVRNAGSVKVSSEREAVFSFYRGDVLIGHSRLESGDAPMAVAIGEFFPTRDFAKFRGEMTPAFSGAGDIIPDWRCLSDLIVCDQTGRIMPWQSVVVSEFEDESAPFAYQAECIGLDTYERDFPHHVAAYENQFREP